MRTPDAFQSLSRNFGKSILSISAAICALFFFGQTSTSVKAKTKLDGPKSERSVPAMPSSNRNDTKGSGGIKEVISEKFRERYEGWKSEFLATETGRHEWDQYANNSSFTLTITISGNDKFGAGTSKYSWDDDGTLVAATIVLGARLNEGYPNPIYYPVMNALAPDATAAIYKSNVLAAAKIAHEFGHVKQVASMNGAMYRLQNQLIPLYNEILLSNGRNTKDPRLVELATRMGGTPVEIWEDREYWGEANAMLFLRDRITDQTEHRELFSRINKSVALYARDYSERFDQIK